MNESVSIIIPCFNGQRTIAATIDSALRQTHECVRVVVVNDGSSDRSREIIDGFGDRILAIHTENRGVSAARNLGTEHSSSDWIVYLDADDLLLDNAVESRLKCAHEHHADVIYSDWQRFRHGSDRSLIRGRQEKRRMEDIHLDPEIACATSFWAPPAALMYHREVVKQIGGWNLSLPVIQDARFLFDAACTGATFAHLSAVTALYLDDDPNSLSRQNRDRFISDVVSNALEIEDRWLNPSDRAVDEEKSTEYRTALASIHDFVARESLHSRQHGLYAESVQRINDLIGLSAASRWVRISHRLQSFVGTRLARQIMALMGR